MLELKMFHNGYCFVLNGKDVSLNEIKEQSYSPSNSERKILINKSIAFYKSEKNIFVKSIKKQLSKI